MTSTHALLAAALAVAALAPRPDPIAPHARCSLAPAPTLALLRIERDTTMPLGDGVREWSDWLRDVVRRDTFVATSTTPMPAARVRLLALDARTRAALVRAGIRETQPVAFIQAAPYRGDCRIVRWTDSIPWVRRGDVGYARASLIPQDRWIRGVPVLIISAARSYPYPRQRALAYEAAPRQPLPSAEVMFSFYSMLEATRAASARAWGGADSAARVAAVAWARANPAAAELEPIRSELRQTILDVDWAAVRETPSRLRGTYRVTLETDGARGTWFFRTHDRPGYTWSEAESARSIAETIASPNAVGYVLVGLAAATRDSLLSAVAADAAGRQVPLVWLSAADRVTAPGERARQRLDAELEFMLGAAPPALWDTLEGFPRPQTREDSLTLARMPAAPRAEKQYRLPLTLRVGADGAVRADTSLTRAGRRLRVSLERIDTTSVRRPF